MKIAVSGSDGFVGGNVCKLLDQAGHEVIRIDISQGVDFVIVVVIVVAILFIVDRPLVKYLVKLVKK